MKVTTLKSTTPPTAHSEQSPVSWKPWDYQKKALRFLLERTGAALWLEPGLGKTAVTLAAISTLKKLGKKPKALVVAPLRVCSLVWPEQAAHWVEFNHLKMVFLHGPKKQELLESEADIYVINPEGLEWLLQTSKMRGRSNRVSVSVDVKAFRKLGFDILVLDELSKFKHTHTVRFKALRHVLPYFDRRWGLTGSPAANGYLDLFGQAYCIDMGAALGEYVTHYRARYFTQPSEFKWVLKEGADKEIKTRLKSTVLSMSADDYLTLPPKIDNIISIELPPKARKVYDEMEAEALTIIKDDVYTAGSAAVVGVKLRQISSGALYKEKIDPLTGLPRTGKREWVEVHDAKVASVVEFVEELQGQPLLLAYEFGHDLERLQKALGKDVPYIGGGVSENRARELERAWNNNELPLLLGHPASVGHGLNFQRGDACHVGFFTLPWDFELYDQFVRRLRRQGNKAARLFCHHWVVRGSIEQTRVLPELRRKQGLERGLKDAFKAKVVAKKQRK